MKTLNRFAMAAAATLMFATLLPAQDVQFKTITKIDLGSMGGAMKMMAKMSGAGNEMVQTTYVHGRKMRSDIDKTSSIIDVDARKIISIDHNKKEYSEVTFEEMKALMESLKNSMSAQGGNKGESQVTTKVDVKLDNTGETQTINGTTAKRYFVTATATITPNEEQRKEGQQGASIVALNDMWFTKDAAYEATAEFGKAMAEAFGDAGKNGMSMLLGMYPGAGDALKKAAEEMRKIDGGVVRQTMYMVTLPEGVKFDRDAALGVGGEKKPEEPKKKGGFGGMLKAAAAKAQGQSDPDDPGKPKTQAVLFKSSSEVTDVQRTSVDVGMFTPPANYKKVVQKNS